MAAHFNDRIGGEFLRLTPRICMESAGALPQIKANGPISLV